MLPKSRNKALCKLYQVIKVTMHWKKKQIFKLLEGKQTNKSKQNAFNRVKD